MGPGEEHKLQKQSTPKVKARIVRHAQVSTETKSKANSWGDPETS